MWWGALLTVVVSAIVDFNSSLICVVIDDQFLPPKEEALHLFIHFVTDGAAALFACTHWVVSKFCLEPSGQY